MARVVSVPDVFAEYGRTMQQAHLFEGVLQLIAGLELDTPSPQTPTDPFSRTEWFFKRPIGWLQRKLDLSEELLAEIDHLREKRNELAHGYLARVELVERECTDDEWRADGLEGAGRMHPAVRAQLDANGIAACDAARAVREQIVDELRELAARFEACNGELYARSFEHFPVASSWDEVEERWLRDERPTSAEAGDL
jgi:hypothetical protein